jgi:hypothetical protein
MAAISSMYGRWTLDCVIEAALAVAHDYVKRYRHYRDVTGGVPDILSSFRSRTGSDPDWPNVAQRSAIYTPLLGGSDAKPGGDRTSTFQQSAATLREAAVAYSERVFDTGEPMLRQAFVDAARNFQAYLSTVNGGVVQDGNDRTTAIFDNAKQVLATAEVAKAFGLPPAPARDWPLAGVLSGDGAYLIEEIARSLQPAGVGPVSQQQFIVLQRIAHYGARTIEGTTKSVKAGWQPDAKNAEFLELIGNAYSWATALRALGK